ncbi:helix-turn-helix domain-containing protein [Streptomyces tanashiensis]
MSGLYAESVAVAYREAAAELTSQGQARRSALVEAVFTASPTAGALGGRPRTGTAGARAVRGRGGEGRHSRARSRSRERRRHCTGQPASAWFACRTSSSLWIALPTDAATTCLRILRRTRARVGFSPRFHSLRDTPQALRFARLALAGLEGAGPGVARFDDNPLAMVVSAAPAEAAHLMEVVLRHRPSAAAIPAAAHAGALVRRRRIGGRRSSDLFVHPNTVRYRLRRVEERAAPPIPSAADFGAALLAVRGPGAG